MSVQKHRTWKTYRYDFQHRGHRFSGDTEKTNKREAREVEKQKREEAKRLLANHPTKEGGPLTFEQAADRWHAEVGCHHKNEDTTVADLDWLTTNIGRNTMLHTLTDARLAELVAKRRGERAWGRKDKDTVKNATVNRSVTMRLRQIVLRAGKVWKVQVPDIEFSAHMLPEPQERVREASVGEEATIKRELSRGYDDALEFAFMTGCRRMEILGMEWTHVDFFSDRFQVTGKYNKTRVIPMTKAVRALLWAQQGYHPKAVWTYEAARTDKRKGIVRGNRYPMTEAGLKTAFRRAIGNSGVENFRMHDTRHTAATRILRESNLRVVRDILGHSDVSTTTKYAHAMDDDLRQAMEAAEKTASPIENPIDGDAECDKLLKGKENRD